MKKTIITGIIFVITLGAIYSFFPKLWGLLLLIAIVYWIVAFFRWMIR